MGDTARWKITLAYRGTAFHGFAAQPGMRTVAGDLADALARLSRLETAPQITCAGRTDAGVHASGQVIHVDLPNPLPSTRDEVVGPETLVRRLNRGLSSDISVLDAEIVDEHFDARHSAISRTYRYVIHEGVVADPLLEGIAWHVPQALDLRAMNQAIASFIGEHDFRAFCRRAPGSTAEDPIMRRVISAGVRDASGSQGRFWWSISQPRPFVTKWFALSWAKWSKSAGIAPRLPISSCYCEAGLGKGRLSRPLLRGFASSKWATDNPVCPKYLFRPNMALPPRGYGFEGASPLMAKGDANQKV